ncbi:MAG: GGDEF domain-containing protein [Candidatus Saccharibacteria bacterium]|nr:GGDEF domain-containing protein [Moraxellaceae bacterium]
MYIDHLVSKIGIILESSPVQKSMIIPYFILFVFTQYLFFDAYWMIRPSPYINGTLIEKILPFKIVCMVIALVMLALKNQLEASSRGQHVVPYIFTSFYLISPMVLGLIGHLSLLAEMVMAAAPLFTMILFKDRVTVLLLILGAISFLFSCLLYIENIVPYAPLFIFDAIPDQRAKVFYSYCTLFLTIPHYFSFIAATYLIVKYWRSREENYRQLSVTDNLMEMANRRGISAYLAQEKSQQHESQPLSIILADIDFFKNVNDTFGHAAGDIVLRHIGASINASLRDSDQVGRYGGEEFLIVLPNTSLESARQIAERCRLIIEKEVILIREDQPIRVKELRGVLLHKS